MKNFEIQLKINNLWTTIINSKSITPMSTFNEKLVKGKNHRYTLTFEILKDVNGKENQFASKIEVSSYLRYIEFFKNKEPEVTDFIVTDKTPEINFNTIKYKIKAEDSFSQKLSKSSEGITIEVLNNTLKNIAEEIIKNSENNNIKIKIDRPDSSFKSILDKKDLKNTFSISGSNLYNALVELSLLFNANMKYIYKATEFYEKDTIVFYDISNMPFKGFRLRPDNNLVKLSPQENISNFTTAMKIYGKDGITVPGVPPLDVMDFFSSQVDFNIKGIDNNREFKDFALVDSQHKYIDLVTNGKIADTSENKKFLTLCDLIPAYNNTLYNFDFFYYKKKLLANDYIKLKGLLSNDLRKYNIKIAAATHAITTSSYVLSTFESELNDYANFLSTECRYFNKQASKEEPSKIALSKSKAKIEEYLEKMNLLLTVAPNNNFHNNIVNIYGYDSTGQKSLGFKTKINETTEKINNFNEENSKIDERLQIIQEKLNSVNPVPSFSSKIILESEEAGLKRKKEVNTNQITSEVLNPVVVDTKIIEYKLVGDELSMTEVELPPSGISYSLLDGGIGAQQIIKQFYTLSEQSFQVAYPNRPFQPSLYDLLYKDDESGKSLVGQRQELIQKIHQKYEDFFFESSYNNNEEVDIYGLFEQAYSLMFEVTKTDLYNKDGLPNEENLSLVQFNYGYRTPKSSYSIAYIDLSSIEGFEFLRVDVGDKIELYNEIAGIDRQMLEVTSINYDLRNPSSTSLGIKTTLESENILQKLIALL